VAGSWYSGDKDALLKEISKYYNHQIGPGELPRLDNKQKLLGIIVPHAGFACSAPVQANAYKRLGEHYKEIDTVIILGPNHRGIGAPISVYPSGKWKTPLGSIIIDDVLGKELIEAAKTSAIEDIIELDKAAHHQEHSIEIQLPFLQQLYKNFKILPICLMEQNKVEMKSLGSLLHQLIQKSQKKIIIVSSTDLTHYDSYETTMQKDNMLIENIQSLDIDKTEKIISTKNITACGPGGIFVLMHLAKLTGFTKVNLLKYANSGDTCSDKTRTVGYAAISFEKP